MEIPITFLSLVENIIVGMLTGASTLAVISYGVCLKHEYPKEGIGQVLIQSIYTLIRLFHIFFAILVTLLIIIYGMLDGVAEAQVEYGVKAAVLFINAVVAYTMAQHWVPVMYASPLIAAGWYFLSGYHSYTLHTASMALVSPILWYIFCIVLLQTVFIALRFFIKPPHQ